MKKILNLLVIILLSFFLSSCQKQGKYPELKLTEKENSLKEADMPLRQPAVAGTFYPADSNILIEKINQFLKPARIVNPNDSLRILIVPHAGYDYSGSTAAWGFKQIENEKYSHIYLIGASHHAYFNQVAVYNKGSWQTPLGTLKINKELANNLINQSNNINANLTVHEQEHSLEIELPFLQSLYANFDIIPILLGHSGSDVLTDLANAIAKQFNDSSLLVVSTDLSHYPPLEVAEKVDKQTINSILSGNINNFDKKINENLNEPGVETCACGADAVKVGMMVAQRMGYKDIRLINYSNSGRTGNDTSRVVGYAAIGFYGNEKIEASVISSDVTLNNEQQQELLNLARETLESYLADKKIPSVASNDKILNKHLGAFVTLRKNGQLRGCIGEFEPNKSLYQVIQEKAVDAAVHDPRFNPVAKSELSNIDIEISVLSPRQRITDWHQIKLGEHGVVVKSGLQGGTYLPQVATETGWNLEQFLNSLCSQKAGLPNDCYKKSSTEIYTFTAQVFSEDEK